MTHSDANSPLPPAVVAEANSLKIDLQRDRDGELSVTIEAQGRYDYASVTVLGRSKQDPFQACLDAITSIRNRWQKGGAA